MEETETEVGSKEQTETEAEQIVAEMVTASLGGADRSRDGHRRSLVSRYKSEMTTGEAW